MRSTKSVWTAKFGYIVSSLLLCALGAALIVHPSFSATALCALMGALLICYGIFKVIGYWSKDLFRLAFQFDLAFGILMIAVGLIMVIRPSQMLALVNLVIGILVLADGLFKIQIALDSKAFGIKAWWLIMALAAAAVVFGILLMVDPFASSALLMILLGISLLAEGILNFCVMICTVKIMKNQIPDTTKLQHEEEP